MVSDLVQFSIQCKPPPGGVLQYFSEQANAGATGSGVCWSNL